MVYLKKFTWKVGFIIGTVFCVSGLQATPACTTSVTTAADFAGLGSGGCQFDNLIFYNFLYNYTALYSPAEPAGSVTVQFNLVGGNPVVSFLGSWDAVNGDNTDVHIDYSVATALPPLTPPLTITGANMTLTGKFGNQAGDTLGGSIASGGETVQLDIPGGGTPTSYSVGIGGAALPSNTPWQQFSSSGGVAFSGQTQISITKDIALFAGSQLYGGAGPGPDDALLTRIDQGLTVTQATPEPVTYFSLGSGLLGIGYLIRRRAGAGRKG
jgi:hypothetical protein